MLDADDFRGRPYGFTTNQISHTAFVGLLLIVYGSCLVWHLIFGEMPYKWLVALLGGIGYLAYEIREQGWNGVDTVEDWWFVNVYGVWAPLTIFSEAPPEVSKCIGHAAFVGDLYIALPWVVLFSIHLMLGAVWRWLYS